MTEAPCVPVELAPGILLGGERLIVIAGPCAVESQAMALEVAAHLQQLCARLEVGFVFKASFDKANRTSADAFRSIGTKAAIDALLEVRERLGIPVLTDVHEPGQVIALADKVDILQIPAFLCRQTDLLQAAARSGKAVNIKKGQFVAPAQMRYAIDKVRGADNPRVFVTERGTSFGYGDLIVDMRALAIMRPFAPIVFDATHSVQLPGGQTGRSGGQRQFVPVLARAAAAAGIDGLFVETHPSPADALSDAETMIPLAEMEELLQMVLAIWRVSKEAASERAPTREGTGWPAPLTGPRRNGNPRGLGG